MLKNLDATSDATAAAAVDAIIVVASLAWPYFGKLKY